MKKLISAIVIGILAIAGLSACTTDTDANVAAHNLAVQAEQFQIERRVVAFNGITDTYLIEVVGRCSIEDQGTQLEVTCKIGPDQFKKHLVGLSDNVSYFVEQLDAVDVDVYHYQVVYKPETIVPYVDMQLSVNTDN